MFKFCLACFRVHVKSISVPCLAGNSESFTLIFEAVPVFVVQLAISEMFIKISDDS